MAAVACSLLLLCGGGVPRAAERGTVSITQRDGRVSLTTRDADLVEVLVRLGQAAGMTIHLGSGSEAHAAAAIVTEAFEDLEIEPAIARLLRGYDYALLYAAAGLAEVRLYSRRDVEVRTPPGSREATSPRTSRPRKPIAAPQPTEVEPVGVDKLREAALADPDASARLRALLRLSELDQPAATLDTALLMLGAERDAAVVDGALDVLGDQDSPPVEPLLAFVRSSQDHGLRIRALELLGEKAAGDLRVVDLLKVAAASDRSSEVRENARALLSAASKP